MMTDKAEGSAGLGAEIGTDRNEQTCLDIERSSQV